MESGTSLGPQHTIRSAIGHDRDGAPTERHIGERPNAASSLRTTAADFARFVAATLRPDIATWWIGSARVHEMLLIYDRTLPDPGLACGAAQEPILQAFS